MTYEAHRLPQLWTMVEPDDGSAAAYHLTTWERQITLLTEQSKRLKDLRADLVAKWPPEQSDASFAFVSRITEMINAMDQTVDDSVKVRTGLKQVSDALEKARKQLEPLLAEYHDKGAAWRSVTHNAVTGNLLASATGVIGADDVVLNMHQRKLDEQAREIMRNADQIVTEARAPLSTQMIGYGRINIPSPAEHIASERPAIRRRSVGEPSPTSTRTLVPPPQFDPPPVVDPGPALARTDPSVVGGVGPGAPGTVQPGVGDARRVVPGVIGGFGSIGKVPERAIGPSPPGQSVLRSGGVIDGHSPAFEPRPTERPAFPGVIGGIGATAMGRGRDGPGLVERAARPPLPGRIIEGGATPSTTSAAGGWRDRQYEEYAKRRQTPAAGDPDSPWTIAEGIAPIIEPPPERRHDVGPGVIGIDR